jgi:hypothetical protein
MNKTYKALDTFSIKKDDKSYVSLVKNQIVSLSDTEYSNLSSLGLLALTDGYKNPLVNSVVDEAQNSSAVDTVTLTFNVYSVTGVWLATDATHAGTNYFTGGSWDGKVLTLGTDLPAAVTAVIVNYQAMGKTITTTGGIIPFTKTFTDVAASTYQKIIQVDFTTTGTMPAGATAVLTAYDANGNAIETRTEILPIAVATTVTAYLSSSFLNDATSYTISGTLPQATPADYTVHVVISEIDAATASHAYISNSGLVSGVNNVNILLLDDDNNQIANKDIVKISVCSDPLGTFSAATVLNGIAAGTSGDIIEFADDQYITVISEDDGEIDLALTPTNAGTPTETVVTIIGMPVNGDIITFGADVYEFTSGTVTDPSYIRVDNFLSSSDLACSRLEAAFNSSGQYNVTAVDSAGTKTYTELTIVDVPVDTDFITFGTEIYEFTTGAVTIPTNIKVDTTGLVGATAVAEKLVEVFNLNTAYLVTASNTLGVVEFTADDLYTTYNALTTTDTEAGVLLAFADATFGGGAGTSVAGVDPFVTLTANTDFVAYNTLATTDTEAGALISFPAATFGDGAGASTTGVDPTASYFLLIETLDGKRFASMELPYSM